MLFSHTVVPISAQVPDVFWSLNRVQIWLLCLENSGANSVIAKSPRPQAACVWFILSVCFLSVFSGSSVYMIKVSVLMSTFATSLKK